MPSSLINPIALACSLLLAAAFLTGCDGGSNLTPEEHISRAKEYQNKKEINAAIIELKNALQKAPDNAQARWLLGKIYVEAGDGSAAEKELRQALKFGLTPQAAAIPLTQAALLQEKFQDVVDNLANYPDLSKDEQAELSALRGNAYLGLHELEKAEKFYDFALSIKPDASEASLGKAQIAAAQNHFDETREWIDKILQTTPKFTPAWSLLGDLERYQGNAKEAEQAYGKAIAQRVNNASDLLNRALVRIYLKDYGGAANDLATLKKQVSDHPSVAYAQGLLDFQQEKYPEAQANFQKAVSYSPDYMPAVFYLGLTQYIQGQVEQAERHLTQFLARFPQSDTAARLLGEMRLHKGDYAGAKSILSDVLARNPNDAQVLALMGDIALRQGKPKEGADYFQQVAIQEPTSAAAYMKLGLGLELSGEHEQGVQILEKAMELGPQMPQADLLVILSHLRAREFDKAIEAAQRMHQKYPNNPNPLTLIGGAYLGKGEEAKAREAFHEALKITPGDPSAIHNLASLEIQKGNLNEATSLYQQALEYNPGHLQTLLRLAALEQRKGDVTKAKALIEQAMEKNPQALDPRILLGEYYLRGKQPQQALAIISDIQDTYPDNPALVALTGKSQLALGEANNALKSFKKLAKLQPKSAAAHYELASAYNETEQFTKARKALEKTLALDPNHAGARFAMAHMLMREGKQKEANEQLQKLKKAHPDDPSVIALEAELALQQNRPQQAIEIYQGARKRFPDSNYWPLQLAKAQQQAGHPEVGLATLEEWLKTHPGDFQTGLIVANNYLLLGQHDRAKSAFTKLHEQAPENVPVLNNLAWLMRKEDLTRALGYAQQALKLAPDNPEVMDTLGTILLEKGQAREAMRLFKKAADKLPQNLDIQFHLAQALAQNSDTAEARKVLQSLLSSDHPFLERDKAQTLLKQLEG
jgi:putative PEP-CTERM system TPR-repeat lipoprotein